MTLPGNAAIAFQKYNNARPGETVGEERIAAHGARRMDYLVVAAMWFAAFAAAWCLAYLSLHSEASRTSIAGSPGFVDLAVRSDSHWYLKIANEGYDTNDRWREPGSTTYAYFPLYPLLISAVAGLTGWSLPVAGLIASAVLFLAALVTIYEYAIVCFGNRSVALSAVGAICVWPQSFVYFAVYTESLFLFLMAATFLAMRRRRYFVAGLCSALGSATRAPGLFLIAYTGVCILRDVGLRGVLKPWRDPRIFLPVVMAPAGLVAYWWFSYLNTGDAFAQATTAGHGWHWRFSWPGEWLISAVVYGGPAMKLVVAVTIATGLGCFLLLPLKLYADFCFCAACLLLFWSGTQPAGLLRYSAILFPVQMAVAATLTGKPWIVGPFFGIAGMLNGVLLVGWVRLWAVAL